MTLSQVTVYANQIAKQRLGYQAISLTNYDNDSEPQIAAGSKVEIGGALFEAVSNENISGWAGISNSSDVYIKLVVSGSTATAEFTTTPPTWSTSKQGWYVGNDRYIGGLYKDASGNYTDKHLYAGFNEKTITTEKIRNLAVTTAKVADANITTAKLTKALTGGSQAISASSSWVPPAGLYIFSIDASALPLIVEIYVSGAWREVSETGGAGIPAGGFFWCDGTNVRIRNSHASNTYTVYYLKLD